MHTYLKVGIVVVLAAAVTAVLIAKNQRYSPSTPPLANTSQPSATTPATTAAPLPRLVDLGADKCVPCKQMAPILVELRNEFAGRLTVDFIDVWKNPTAGEKYAIRLIPTQIFFDAAGQELARHEGFMSKEDILTQWSLLGVSLAAPPQTLVRETPLIPSTRPADHGCFMCDGDLVASTQVEVTTAVATRRFCAPHCFFIYLSSLPNPAGIEQATTVKDTATGQILAAPQAFYHYQHDPRGRPLITAAAAKSRPGAMSWDQLKAKELALRCAFCDRANYPEDASKVKVDGANLYACCPVCGLGVAARLQKDLDLEVKDALTGQALQITTLNGSVASLTPSTVIAWHGQKKNADGKMVSAGCFKQYFFATPENLHKWLEQHPETTGKMATIGELLADKMKLNPQQIKSACKIGDCVK